MGVVNTAPPLSLKLLILVPCFVPMDDMDTTVTEPFDFATPEMNDDSDSDGVSNDKSTTKKNSVVFVEKRETVQDSATAGKLTDIRKLSKRTNLQRRMGNERFDTVDQPVFRQKKSGFCTERPVEWMIAVEKYIAEYDDVQALWRYKVDDSSRYFECEISVWFDTTTEVLLRINLVTGVFLVEGAHYRTFIDGEFEKIRKKMETNPNDEQCVTAADNHELVFEKIEENKKAIKTMEESVVKLLEIFEETNKREGLISDVSEAVKRDELLELEKKYDEKLTVFMEGYSEEINRKIENVCKSFDKKIENIRQVIGQFKMSTQKQINELYLLFQRLSTDTAKDPEGTVHEGTPATSPNIINLQNKNIEDWVKEGEGRNEYIGRGSKWGNRHRLCDYDNDRHKVIELFKSDLMADEDWVEEVKKELKGKVLGCFCAPELCHGEFLHQLAGNHPHYDRNHDSAHNDTDISAPEDVSRVDTTDDVLINANPEAVSDRSIAETPERTDDVPIVAVTADEEVAAEDDREIRAPLPNPPNPLNPNPHLDANSSPTNHTRRDRDMEMLVLMDSNNKFVDWDRFFSFVRGPKHCTFTGSLYETETIIDTDEVTRKIDYVVISIGVNDLDTKSAEEVLTQLKRVIELLRNKHEHPKVIISEATPRRDDRDDELKKYNDILKEYVDEHDYLFLAKQSKLRTEDGRHYYDDKHFTQYAVAIFVASLKWAMRAAYGLNPKRERNDHRRDGNNRGTEGSGRGRGNDRWRGGGRGRGRGGGFRPDDRRQGGMAERFDYRGEFEKFKTEMRTLVAGILPGGDRS